LRVSFDCGVLNVMTASDEYERYVSFLRGLITAIQLRLRIRIESFGAMTMRKESLKTVASRMRAFMFSAARIENRIHVDLTADLPHDIVVEVHVQHDSSTKLGIYAAAAFPAKN